MNFRVFVLSGKRTKAKLIIVFMGLDLRKLVKLIDSEIVEVETRDTIVGITESWKILSVVFTVRKNDVFRLISTRRATSAETSRKKDCILYCSFTSERRNENSIN